MLTKEDNEILCRVGPGHADGRPHAPVLDAGAASRCELPAPDCPPLRMRLLGEDLIAFRDTAGRGRPHRRACPHRGASMFFGRNEEDGLRCVYHGWKFDVTGACVDMPSEPAESNFKNKVHDQAYPTQRAQRHRLDLHGPARSTRRRCPTSRPTCVAGAARRHRSSTCGSATGSRRSRATSTPSTSASCTAARPATSPTRHASVDLDTKPHFEMVTDRVRPLLRRPARGRIDKYHWRINHFAHALLHAVTGPFGKVWMPIDDYNTLVMEWSPSRSPDMPRELRRHREHADRAPALGLQAGQPDDPLGQLALKADVDNEWLRDRSLEKNQALPRHLLQPAAGLGRAGHDGPIYDRTREFLGTTDKAIIAFRRIMVRPRRTSATRASCRRLSTTPSSTACVAPQRCCPRKLDWIEASAQWRVAFTEGPPEDTRIGVEQAVGGAERGRAAARRPDAASRRFQPAEKDG